MFQSSKESIVCVEGHYRIVSYGPVIAPRARESEQLNKYDEQYERSLLSENITPVWLGPYIITGGDVSPKRGVGIPRERV